MQIVNVSAYRPSRSSLRRAYVLFLTVTLVLVPLSYVLRWSEPAFAVNSVQPVHAFASNVVEPVFTTMLGGGNAGIVRHSSPILADVDGNSSNGLEIVVGTLQNQSSERGHPAYLSVLKADGSVLWEVPVEGSINSSPAVGDINGGGDMEIVVGLGAENEPQTPGGVVAYSASGTRLWKISTLDRIGGGAGHNLPNGLADGVFASPSIANLDDDAENEVIFGAWDQRIHLVNGNDGSVLSGSGSGAFDSWPAEMLDTIWSSPAIADLNNDQKLDMVFGGDISANPAAGTNNGGILRAMSHDSVNGPTYLPGFDGLFGNICPGGACPTDIAHYGVYVDQSIYASPAIGDLDGDGDYEIVTGSGRPFSAGTLGHWVKVYDHQGNLLTTLTTDGVVFGSPALADLNSDGYLDIVVGTEILNDNAGLAGRGTVYAWSGRYFSQLWHTDPAIIIGHLDIMPVTSSPIVADIDPNYSGPEVLFGLGPEICVLSGSTGEQLTADDPSSPKPTLWMGLSPVSNSPAVADIDLDGTLEIVAAGEYYPISNQVRNYHGWVVAWHWPSATGNAANAYLPWPMFRRDAQHSGLYTAPPASPPATPPASPTSTPPASPTATPTPSPTATPTAPPIALPQIPTSVSILHEIGNNPLAVRTLRLRNSGGAPFNFYITNLPIRVDLSSTWGQIPAGGELSLTMIVNTAGLGERTYKLGWLEVYDSDTDAFSGDISVNVIVGELNHVYLPMTSR